MAETAGAVPHPLHAHLTSLLKRVGAVQTRLTNKQQKPAAAISDSTAWISPAATRWTGEFMPQAAKYVGAVRALNDDLEQLLRRTPPTCTPEEAARWKAKLGGPHGA